MSWLIYHKKGGFLSSFCIETSEQYLEKEYGISADEFLSIIQQKYLDLKMRSIVSSKSLNTKKLVIYQEKKLLFLKKMV